MDFQSRKQGSGVILQEKFSRFSRYYKFETENKGRDKVVFSCY